MISPWPDWRWWTLPPGTPWWNEWEVGWIESHIGPLEGLLVLDVGAGDGRFVGALQNRGAWAVGVDCKPRHPAIGETRFPSLDGAPLVQPPFELICFRESLYYMDFPAVIRATRRMLLPGGFLYIKSAAARRPRPDDWRHDPTPDGYAEWLADLDFRVIAERDYPRGWRRRAPERFMLIARKENPHV